MKQQPSSKGLLSLTSDQIEEALAKGFIRFVNATAKPHRRTSVNIPDALLQKFELGPKRRASKLKSETGTKGKKTGSTNKKSKKGRTPIRSQTGHDHDRNHHKY